MKPDHPVTRRQMLKTLGAGLPGATLLALAPEARAQAPAADPSATTAAAPPAAAPTWKFFNAEEAALMDAIAARLIPADDLGPGAKEAGVTAFIDGQLAGAWGTGDQFYRNGPYAPGTPQQGYQLSYTPAEMFRTGLARFRDAVGRAHGGQDFAALDAAAQDALLTRMQAGQLDFSPLPAAIFFAALLDATIEGFFSDPIHGGNRDMVGWKLVQFPGAYASYSNDIERHGVALVRAPVSIADGPRHGMDMQDMHGASGASGAHGTGAPAPRGAAPSPATRPQTKEPR
ncbi:gluconate 2-dehydrogenase subunit 3 family protein [Achromobacter aloeverae]|uniref:Gluconate 2-dehydrogenase n=1 Tax=Achromobacter aloeverae TaxID=1750518 RepID=A0A4Q1HGD2_9BURK|nr:gluconate 2-dehydrogenase subunit 3 family protein [Achromobacter aloeverae]RXN86179.1 gluconate 2-dehydrogenase [Achromobacter aloeverae]